ncbi:35287_t:CDS:2, partial [Gigaspora margarita]
EKMDENAKDIFIGKNSNSLITNNSNDDSLENKENTEIDQLKTGLQYPNTYIVYGITIKGKTKDRSE